MTGHGEAGGPSLVDLPPEVLSEIFSFFVGTPSIQAVLKTCRTLYDVALPLSVSIFRNTASPPGRGYICSPSRNAQFLRYILISKPSLPQHVKTVVLGNYSTLSRDRTSAISADSELAVCRQKMDSILDCISDEDLREWFAKWIADLEKGSNDAQISLILLVCPNIKTLLFEESLEKFGEPRHFTRLLKVLAHLFWVYARALNEGSGPKIPLSNLQDVFHEASNNAHHRTAWYIRWPMLFALPRLRFYECHLPRGDTRTGAKLRDLQPRSSLVEEITLRFSRMHPSMLFELLNSCKALRKFEYITREAIVRPEDVAPPNLLESILLHSESLTELYINTEGDWDRGWRGVLNDPMSTGKGLGIGLCNMVALRKLTVDMRCLTGMLAAGLEEDSSTDTALELESSPRLIDCLPENLEYLKIHSCGAAIHDQASELLRAVEQGRFMHLTQINFLFALDLFERPSPLYCTAPNVRLCVGPQTPDRGVQTIRPEGEPEGDDMKLRGLGRHSRLSS
ncbi:unnamed protein product [Clonostachys rosea]|uniref:F-box domain-containing protein n=1 Tax=Bionectria ochroleuca TaxID=29856 RepID=A0ABY6TT72_BIOOC|nr:unnamed protein product [Clonostachys rosea]